MERRRGDPARLAAVEGTTTGRQALRRIALGLWLLLCLAAVPCLVLWMTFTEVLVASRPRGQDRVPACVYFTGAGLAERPPPRGAGGAGPEDACPLVVRRG